MEFFEKHKEKEIERATADTELSHKEYERYLDKVIINKTQFEGVHEVKKSSERVFIDAMWSIEVPKGYTYSMDDNFTAEMMFRDEHYLLQVQDTETCNLPVSYGAEFNFVVFPIYSSFAVFTCDLLSSKGKRGIKEFLDSIAHLKKKKKLIHTKEIAVYYGMSKNTKDVTECSYYVFVRGFSCAYRGQFVITKDTKEIREKEICRWLNTIKAVSNNLMSEEFRCLHSGEKEQISFEKNNDVIVDDNLKIAVADNFKYSIDKMVIGEGRKLAVIPKTYSFEEEPMDASIGFSIAEATLDVSYDQDNLEHYFSYIAEYAAPDLFLPDSPVHTAKAGKEGAILYQVFYNCGENFTKCNAMIFSGGKIYLAFCCINHGKIVYNNLTHLDGIHIINTWLSKCKYENEPETNLENNLVEGSLKLNFTVAEPDDDLYPHYRSIQNLVQQHKELGGVRIEVNTSGTECAFVSLESILQYQEDFGNDEDIPLPEEVITVYKHCVEKDKGIFSAVAQADEFRKLFRVNEDVFDFHHDRECEIKNGQIHRAYMVSALRSFAWTLADYCAQNNLEPTNVDFSTLSAIIDFCAEREWLNYDDEQYCQGLCSGSDLHGYYVPQKLSQKDIGVLLPDEEELQWTADTGILSEVHFLELLRKDLTYLEPAIFTLWNELAQNRDYSRPLIGNIADVVYAWCAFVLAAQKPFFMEDGPMSNFFSRCTDESKLDVGMFAKKTTPKAAARNSKVIASNIRDFCINDGILTKYKGKEDSIAIPEGVVNIGDGAFRRLKKLKVVELPQTLKIIGKRAFDYCENMKDIYIPEGVEKIEAGAFSSCKRLKTVTLPHTLKTIGDKAFNYCEFLTSVSIPDGVTKIGKEAFCNCENLADIYVPASVIKFGKDVFNTGKVDQRTVIHAPVGSAAEKYAAEQGLTIDNDMTDSESIGHTSYGNDDFRIMDGKLMDYSGECENLVIPEGVKTIEVGAFCSCKKLKTVKLPQTLETIGKKAFEECINLKEIIVPEGVIKIEKGAFHKCKKLRTVKLPSTLRVIGDRAFNNCENLAEINLSEGLEEIGSLGMAGCKSLDAIKLPSTLRVIGDRAFFSCKNLTQIDIPEGVTEIEGCTFHSCINLETVNLSTRLEKISNNAFSSCESLTSILIPEGVVEIGEGAFYNCKNLTQIDIPEGVTEIEERTFRFCESLTSILIPERVTEIGEGAFLFCKKLKNVKLPESLNLIGAEAFAHCDDLTEIYIPASVGEIGRDIFGTKESTVYKGLHRVGI